MGCDIAIIGTDRNDNEIFDKPEQLIGSRFRAQGTGCRVLGSGFWVLGSKVQGSKVQRFNVQGSKVLSSGFRVN